MSILIYKNPKVYVITLFFMIFINPVHAQDQNSTSKTWNQKLNSFVRKEQKKINNNFKKIENFFTEVANSLEGLKEIITIPSPLLMENEDEIMPFPSLEFKCQATFQMSFKINNKKILEDLF